MTTPRFTEEEITARARQLADGIRRKRFVSEFQLILPGLKDGG
jgi:hypothetical protein